MEERIKNDKPVKKERKAEVQKTNRKGEEAKKRKKKEERRLAERKKKKDKAAKKERKFGLKTKVADKEMCTSISTPNSSGGAKVSKIPTTTPSPEKQDQSPTKHKHRERSEREERTHRTSAKSSTQTSSDSENHKTPEKSRGHLKVSAKEQLLQSPCRDSNDSKTSKRPTVILSRTKVKPKAKADDTLPSLLFKALEPLTTACSVSLEKPIHDKDDGQGVLNAPDLQPVAVMGNLQELGDNLANTPPVLSWQGSPVSDLGDDEEELEKGVISRPVLQPSPTQCFSPPPVDTESSEVMSGESSGGDVVDDSQSATPRLGDLPCKTEQTAKEEKEEQVDCSGETSMSLLSELRHHKTGLDDVFKSLANFLGGQKVTCRGGPFGGPVNTERGIKSSSALALGPEIHEHQDFFPKLDPLEPSNQSPTHSTSDEPMKSNFTTDPKEPVMETQLQKKQEQTENNKKEKQEDKKKEIIAEKTEPSPLDRSLSAKLRLTTTHTASFTSLITVTAKDGRGSRKETDPKGTDKKRKRKCKDEEREGEIKIKIKTEESSVICPKNKQHEKGRVKERGVSSSVLVISRNSPRPRKDSMKGQTPQENQTKHGKEKKASTGNAEEKIKTQVKEKDDGFENKTSAAAGNINKTPSSVSAVTINTSKSCASTPAMKTPSSLAPVDPLKLKALSMGLCKELKILLIKLEINGRQTFNISELEAKKIPLTKISIENTAAEVIRACK